MAADDAIDGDTSWDVYQPCFWLVTLPQLMHHVCSLQSVLDRTGHTILVGFIAQYISERTRIALGM